MFVNLAARKPNGDFYITSTDVIKDHSPQYSDVDAVMEIMKLANTYFANGYNIELTREAL